MFNKENGMADNRNSDPRLRLPNYQKRINTLIDPNPVELINEPSMGLSYSKETESESDYVPMENSIPIFQPLNFRAVPPIAQPSKETSPKNHDPSQLTKLQLPKKPVSNSTSSTPVSSFSGEGNESPLISPTTEKKKPREIEIIHKDFKKLFEYSSTLNPEMAFIKADKITICENFKKSIDISSELFYKREGYKKTIYNMDRDLRLSKTENKDLYAKHEQLRMKNLELEKELANKNSKLEKFESENVDCHNKEKVLINRQKIDLGFLDEKNKKLESEKFAFQKDLKKSELDLSEMKKKYDEISTKLSTTEKMCDINRDRLKERDEKIKEMEENMIEKIKFEKCQKENDELSKQLNVIFEKSKMDLLKKDNQLSETNNKFVQLQQQFEKCQEENKLWKKNYDEISTKLSTEQNCHKIKCDLLKKYEKQFEEMKEKNVDNFKLKKEIEKLQKENDELKNFKNQYCGKQNMRIEFNPNEIQKLNEIMNDLNEKLNNKNEEIKLLNEKNGEYHKLITTLKSESKKLFEDNLNWKNKYENFTIEKDFEIQIMKQENVDLKKQFETQKLILLENKNEILKIKNEFSKTKELLEKTTVEKEQYKMEKEKLRMKNGYLNDKIKTFKNQVDLNKNYGMPTSENVNGSFKNGISQPSSNVDVQRILTPQPAQQMLPQPVQRPIVSSFPKVESSNSFVPSSELNQEALASTPNIPSAVSSKSLSTDSRNDVMQNLKKLCNDSSQQSSSRKRPIALEDQNTVSKRQKTNSPEVTRSPSLTPTFPKPAIKTPQSSPGLIQRKRVSWALSSDSPRISPSMADKNHYPQIPPRSRSNSAIQSNSKTTLSTARIGQSKFSSLADIPSPSISTSNSSSSSSTESNQEILQSRRSVRTIHASSNSNVTVSISSSSSRPSTEKTSQTLPKPRANSTDQSSTTPMVPTSTIDQIQASNLTANTCSMLPTTNSSNRPATVQPTQIPPNIENQPETAVVSVSTTGQIQTPNSTVNTRPRNPITNSLNHSATVQPAQISPKTPSNNPNQSRTAPVLSTSITGQIQTPNSTVNTRLMVPTTNASTSLIFQPRMQVAIANGCYVYASMNQPIQSIPRIPDNLSTHPSMNSVEFDVQSTNGPTSNAANLPMTLIRPSFGIQNNHPTMLPMNQLIMPSMNPPVMTNRSIVVPRPGIQGHQTPVLSSMLNNGLMPSLSALGNIQTIPVMMIPTTLPNQPGMVVNPNYQPISQGGNSMRPLMSPSYVLAHNGQNIPVFFPTSTSTSQSQPESNEQFEFGSAIDTAIESLKKPLEPTHDIKQLLAFYANEVRDMSRKSKAELLQDLSGLISLEI